MILGQTGSRIGIIHSEAHFSCCSLLFSSSAFRQYIWTVIINKHSTKPKITMLLVCLDTDSIGLEEKLQTCLTNYVFMGKVFNFSVCFICI